MKGIDLLNLDIRILDPFFGAKDKAKADRKKVDFGIVYLDGSDLKIVKIQGGWKIIKGAASNVFGTVSWSLRPLYRKDDWIIEDILAKKPEESRFPKPKFITISDRFVEEYALGRLESDIMSAGEYIKAKQNMPFDDPERMGCSEESYEIQKSLVDRLETSVQSAPQLIGLPKNLDGMYREVRLDNRFSRCMGNAKDYKKFCEGDSSPNNSLTICDMVVQYSEKEFYIVEVKVHHSQTGTHYLYPWQRKLANTQLAKAALFFQKNFGVYPTLVRALLSVDPSNKKLRVSHWKYYDGALHQIKYKKD